MQRVMRSPLSVAGPRAVKGLLASWRGKDMGLAAFLSLVKHAIRKLVLDQRNDREVPWLRKRQRSNKLQKSGVLLRYSQSLRGKATKAGNCRKAKSYIM